MPLKTRQNLPLFVAVALVDLKREVRVFRCLCLFAGRQGGKFTILAPALFRLPFAALFGLPFTGLFGLPFAALVRLLIPFFAMRFPALLRLTLAPLFGLRFECEKTRRFTGGLPLFGGRLAPPATGCFAPIRAL